MKIFVVLVLVLSLLSGCGKQAAVETVEDTLAPPAAAEPREISVELPGEAAIPTMEDSGHRYYLCNDYEIAIDTRESGDLQETIRQLSGCDPENLTVVSTREKDADRYEFVWSSTGEQGQRLGRAVILDDGNYHYTMSVLRDADNTEKLQVVWRQVFSSFHLA